VNNARGGGAAKPLLHPYFLLSFVVFPVVLFPVYSILKDILKNVRVVLHITQ
jgi:hypothetical protein